MTSHETKLKENPRVNTTMMSILLPYATIFGLISRMICNNQTNLTVGSALGSKRYRKIALVGVMMLGSAPNRGTTTLTSAAPEQP